MLVHGLTFCPSSQLIHRSPLVRKHATACLAKWWIHPSCLSWVMMASMKGYPVRAFVETQHIPVDGNTSLFILKCCKGSLPLSMHPGIPNLCPSPPACTQGCRPSYWSWGLPHWRCRRTLSTGADRGARLEEPSVSSKSKKRMLSQETVFKSQLVSAAMATPTPL